MCNEDEQPPERALLGLAAPLVLLTSRRELVRKLGERMRVPSSLPLLTSASCDYVGDRSDNLPSRSLSVISPTTTTTASVIVCFSWTHGELSPSPLFLPSLLFSRVNGAGLRRFYCEMARNQPTLRVTLSVHRALSRKTQLDSCSIKLLRMTGSLSIISRSVYDA